MATSLLKMLKYTLCLPLNLLFLLSCCLPKNKELWLFGAWFGEKYLDNPKYIYQELCENNQHIKTIWIVKNKKLLNEFLDMGYPVAYAYSLRGIWFQLRAGVIVFTHGVSSDYFSCAIGVATKRIQTWHGMPIKKIGYDDKNAGLETLQYRLMELFLPFRKDRIDLVFAASEFDRVIYSSAFRLPIEKVKIVGYPRNDILFRNSSERSQGNENLTKVIYMPTLRGAPNSEFKLLSGAGFDFEQANFELNRLGAKLYIKLHPVQRFLKSDLELIGGCSSIEPIFNTSDIYESLGSYDVLITDYSGIYFDFLITGKWILMAPFDLNDYIKLDREIYYDYVDICPGDPCISWEMVFEKLRDMKSGCEVDPRYFVMQKRFHGYLDDKSSLRAIEEIRSL